MTSEPTSPSGPALSAAVPALPERSLVILRTGDVAPAVAAHRGEFADWIRHGLGDSWSHEIVVLDARQPLPPSLRPAAALIITGSPSSVTEQAPWMLALEEALRDAIAADIPILGICFGHQLLAKALGGAVDRNPRGREIGTIHVDRHHDDPLFDTMPTRFEVNSTHVDTVRQLPAGARILATSSLDEVAAFALGRVRGVQFHPEMDGDAMRRLIDVRRPILASEGFDVDAMLAAVIDTPAGATILRNFIRALPHLR